MERTYKGDSLGGKFKPQNFIKVDLNYIQIQPTNQLISSTKEAKVAFLLRYTSQAISI
ncbi:3621_t:CDS:2, partial [Acaulospora colombiana]